MVMLLLFYDVLDQLTRSELAQIIWHDIGECFTQKALNIMNRVVCGVAKRFRQRPIERSRGAEAGTYGYCWSTAIK